MILDILAAHGYKGTETLTDKWTPIVDERPEYRKAFRTERIGKIDKHGAFYVTLSSIREEVVPLILATGAELLQQPSSGQKNVIYPGFHPETCSHESLTTFVQALRGAADAHVSRP